MELIQNGDLIKFDGDEQYYEACEPSTPNAVNVGAAWVKKVPQWKVQVGNIIGVVQQAHRKLREKLLDIWYSLLELF